MNKELQVKRAIAILKEAKAHDVLDKPIPEDDDLKIKVADYIVGQARKAREAGEEGEHVIAILFTADVDFTTGEIKEKGDDREENEILEETEAPTEDEAFYRAAIKETVKDHLPIPKEPDDEPELPFDLTAISDKNLRFLHGAFNACFARAAWLYAINEAGEAAAKQIADHKEDEYIVGLGDERKDFGGKAKSAALLKAEAAANDDAIVEWRDRQKKHAIQGNRYRRLRDIYESNVDRLSREGTLREDERKHA